MKILVTGGAGYIGSFMTKRLLDEGYSVVVVDSLERGYSDAIDARASLVVGNFLEKSFVADLLEKNSFDAVIHFAGFISMGESMEKPELYFSNNTFGTLNLLEELTGQNVNRFIFSSTAGVYGNPIKVPISEDHPKNPTNPYGESKLMVERMLSWYQKIHSLNFVALRYFNAAGASLDANLGERHNPETHIIPNAILSALRHEQFKLYGNDYPTNDGTCVRDYIHVLDLVEAHVLALKKLENNSGGYVYNVGTGTGHTNLEVISMIRKVSGIDFEIVFAPRRPGDAEQLIADPTKIQTELGFAPKYSDLETIVITALNWHSKNFKSSPSTQ